MSGKSTRACSLAGGILLVFGATGAYAGNVGVDLNLHLGDRPQQVIVREQAPPPPPQNVIVEENIEFVYPEQLGFYVAVGVPYDLFFVNNHYFLYRNGIWFRGPNHRGPWIVARGGELPPGLRRYKVERIRHLRDREYNVYRRDNDGYRGRHFRSGKEGWKEERKENKERWKDEKRAEKEERKDERREHGHGNKHDRD